MRDSRSADPLLQRLSWRAASSCARRPAACAPSRDSGFGIPGSGTPWSLGRWNLGFGYWLGLGLWDLGLGTFRDFVLVFLTPEKLRVRPWIDDRLAVADLDDLRRELLDEVAIVRHEDQRAAVVLERVEQHVLRIEIEVVGRLVEQQRVRRAQQHARDGEPRALAARQHGGLLVDVVAGEEEAAEDVANRRDHVGRRTGRERLVHRQRRVEPHRFVLREVLDDDLVTDRCACRCPAPLRRTACASASTCRIRWDRPARCDRRARCAARDP